MGKSKKNTTDRTNHITKVGTIRGYIEAIQKFSGDNIFYRGHSNKEYELKPGIYRGDIIKNEDKIYRETIAKVPYDFKDKNTIESLALMQHYGIPTRILDLTTNALVALYFACVGNEDKDGEVIVFDIPEENICYFDSDRVTVLANLAKSDKEFHYRMELLPVYKQKLDTLEQKKEAHDIFITNIQKSFNIHNYIHEKKGEEIEKYLAEVNFDFESTIDDKIKEWFSEYQEQNTDNYDDFKSYFRNIIVELLQSIIRNNTIPYTVNVLNEKYFGKLLHNIREDKSYFQSIINPDDINNIFAVQPKLDNPRIVRQHGAFLIFGIKPYKYSDKEIKPMPEINPKWIMSNGKNEKNKRIIIKGEEKRKILKELEIFGINKSFLFPEIDKVAEDIKEKYNTNK
jgi:hypothetical protein